MLDWVAMRITPAAGGLLNLSSALGPYDLLPVENDISPILTPASARYELLARAYRMKREHRFQARHAGPEIACKDCVNL